MVIDWGELSAEGSEIEIWQVNVPTLLGSSIETLRVALAPTATVPETGERWHQGWELEEVQEEEAKPELDRTTVFGAGAASPLTALKERAEGLRFRWGLVMATALLTITETRLELPTFPAAS